MGWLRRRLPLFGVVTFGTIGGMWCGYAMGPHAGVGVSRDDAPSLRLPADARNINYYVRPPASYYDFDTTEAGVTEFAGNWRLSWNKTEGQGYAIAWDHATNSRKDVRIEDGIYFGWSKDDANWWLAYDRKSGRAYCSGTYR